MDRFTVGGIQVPATWQLVDAVGAVCRSGALEHGGALIVAGIGLAPGSYLLRIISAQGAEVVRLVKVGG